MEIRIFEEKANRLVFDVAGVDHTVCNAIKEELLANDNIKAAGYEIDHPIVGLPKFVVETKKGTDAKKAVMDALKVIKNNIQSLSDSIKKLKI